ncbi:MAG: hypothetical protein CL859_04145, partial [Cyanobium sp. ARS6]|nr:hypothetical protein [Cyanobium sp. ARS6]
MVHMQQPFDMNGLMKQWLSCQLLKDGPEKVPELRQRSSQIEGLSMMGLKVAGNMRQERGK